MSSVKTTLAAATIAFLAVGAAHADPFWPVACDFTNTDQWFYSPDTWNSPTATTGGALWIDTGEGPVKASEDCNLQLWAKSLTIGWTPIHTMLLSDGTATAGSYGDILGEAGPDFYGMIMNANLYVSYIPGSSLYPTTVYDLRVYAWSGLYDTYTEALAAGEYVGDSGIFSQVCGGGGNSELPPNVPGMLTSMPATILRHVLVGDANLDGTVNISDLSKVLTNYDKTDMQWADGDFNNDGTVNIADLSNVLTNYDKTAAAAAGPTAVPEPGTLSLCSAMLASLLALVGRRRT
jgi:hypothetical protein